MASRPPFEERAHRPILLAVDGESHTGAAIAEACRLAGALDRTVAVLHVEDDYLKQFSNEIYAQGREEYLEHVDRCLAEEGREAVAEARARVLEDGVESEALIRKGEPFDAIRAELETGAYSLLIVGRKPRSGGRLRRRQDLPARLADAGGSTPLLIVPGESATPAAYPDIGN
ncbi:MAG: universal stress protein [Acidobacteriota bacterium]|nr:universal stress protein [Acidobacteriota bacterium]